MGTIAVVIALALLGELFELWFGYGLARRYGGSKRGGCGVSPLGAASPLYCSLPGFFSGRGGTPTRPARTVNEPATVCSPSLCRLATSAWAAAAFASSWS